MRKATDSQINRQLILATLQWVGHIPILFPKSNNKQSKVASILNVFNFWDDVN